MYVVRKMGLLVIAAGVCLLGTMQHVCCAQQATTPQAAQGSTPQAAAAQQFPSQLTDTPVAPPNTEAMRLASHKLALRTSFVKRQSAAH